MKNLRYVNWRYAPLAVWAVWTQRMWCHIYAKFLYKWVILVLISNWTLVRGNYKNWAKIFFKHDIHFVCFSIWDGFFWPQISEDEWWEIHLAWKTIQNHTFSRILHTSRHIIHCAKLKIMKTMWDGFISQLIKGVSSLSQKYFNNFKFEVCCMCTIICWMNEFIYNFHLALHICTSHNYKWNKYINIRSWRKLGTNVAWAVFPLAPCFKVCTLSQIKYWDFNLSTEFAIYLLTDVTKYDIHFFLHTIIR